MDKVTTPGNKSIHLDDAEERRRWIRNEFMGILNTDLINNPSIKDAVIKIDIHKSHMRRFEKWNLLYMLIMVPGVCKMICSLIVVHKDGKYTNVAYIYSAIHTTTLKVIPLYICTGVNMLSADGEYRGRFIRMHSLEAVYDTHVDFISDIEQHIYNKEYDVDIHNFHSLGGISNLTEKVKQFVMKTLVVIWFCEVYLIHFNLQNRHTNPVFNEIMFDDTDVKMFNRLIEKYGRNLIYMFYRRCTVLVYSGPVVANRELVDVIPTRTSIGVECGQKLIPLRISDVMNIMNPITRVWREIIIWKMVSNLPLNMITPGIPMYNLWFAINNSRCKLFNNPHMLEKHASPSPENKKTNLSDITIAIICESTGSTIKNTLIFHKSKEYIAHNRDLFTDPDYFMKYLFEIAYTLYCLNTKCGVIHSDLHLNNTTLNSLYFPYFDYALDELNVTPGPDDVILYHIGNEMYYMFPHVIKYATVIDFSRSIVKPSYISQYLVTKADRVVFNAKQVSYIMQWYANHLPDLFTEYQVEIKKACATRFDTVFKIISAVDMYYHTTLLLKFFDKNPRVKKHDRIDNVLKKIIVMTRHYLESGMRSLAQDINWKCPEWPNMEVLKRCFADYMIDTSDNASIEKINVVDFFNYDNPLRYEFTNPKKIPPRFVDVRNAKKDWGMPGYKDTEITSAGNQHRERENYNKSVIAWASTVRKYVG